METTDQGSKESGQNYISLGRFLKHQEKEMEGKQDEENAYYSNIAPAQHAGIP